MWRLVSSTDGESFSGTLCAGGEEEKLWDLQPMNGAETFPGVIWNEKASSHWTQPSRLQGPILGKTHLLYCHV